MLVDSSYIQRLEQRLAAYTIIELLVSIVVIALLLAIGLPALSHAHQAARTLHCITSIRTSTFNITSYANGHDGLVPSIPQWIDMQHTSIAFPQARQDFPDGASIQMSYFPAGRWWAAALLADRPLDQSWTCPQYRDSLYLRNQYFYDDQPIFYAMGRVVPLSSYEMSEAFRASPRYWKSGIPGRRKTVYLSSQKLDLVAYPSRKVLLYERIILHDNTPPYSFWNGSGPVAMTDGSAKVRSSTDAREGVFNQFDFPNQIKKIRNTKYGIFGLDY